VRRAFAAVLLVPAFLGCADESPRAWRVASYNAWGVPFSKDLAGRFRRLPPALLALEPDVICLQEVWAEPQREAIRVALEGRYRVAASRGGGLFLASRFPILEESFTAFPSFEGLSLVERLARKGWLEAVLDAPGGRVRVVTTHLALEGPRHLQLEVLARHLDARRDLPVVLAGDLNTSATDASFRRLVEAGWRDARDVERAADGAPAPRAPTRVGWPRSGRPGGWSPDHVLLRDGLSALRTRLALDTPEAALSDHNLLLVDLAREPSARPERAGAER
jgi:endonuclease/exonuclease/phosphatase family metal-dependent hydrolase